MGIARAVNISINVAADLLPLRIKESEANSPAAATIHQFRRSTQADICAGCDADMLPNATRAGADAQGFAARLGVV